MRSPAVVVVLSSLSWAGLALAHMRMFSPRPYGASTLNNSPLGNTFEKTAFDFPCKQRAGVYDLDGASNSYAIGSTQILGLVGEAVHGGGSCQISLTTDLQPTNSSVFKVIHTVIGGCPASGVAGNLGGDNDANSLDPWSFEYTIPTDVPAGQYTLAWTWFNDLGNREMYMNCAPLTLTGDGGSTDSFDALPDMFIANILYTPFSTNYGGELDIPNPGKQVAFHGASAPIPPLSDGNTFAMPAPTASGTILSPAYDITATTIAVQGPLNGVDTAWPSTSQMLPGQTAPAAVPAPAPAPAAAAVVVAALTITGDSFITSIGAAPGPTPSASPPAAAVPAPAQATPTTVAAVAPAEPEPVEPAPVALAPSFSAPSSPVLAVTGMQAPGSPCSTPGFYICMTTKFQVCASGTWSVAMAVADGTVCLGGGAQNLQIVAVPARRRAVAFRA